ncbi:putative membrane protein [Aquimarina sp. MAR_2010_214]|uniref:anthrone oxygenase family protein n=1 Tax=Aquimarina sp. MAR_2010_214 TaxID=1250026 RepID=UPI000C6FD0F1|nr:DUF1772 domain-containing protein [Aquimarina sp. MAR_2010_214]PKV50543.1 putative membrane protein [Aquimarina sp. MAR_2010_214]
MELSLKLTSLLLTVLLTGLSAGLCFTWSNTVISGIGKLDNFSYLQAFQQMNRTILNPAFFIVFFGPVFLNLINTYVFRNVSTTLIWLLISSTLLYFFGVVLITIFGNVPLNEVLDKSDLNTLNIEELRILRDSFEIKWNRLHLIRTISSSISFLLLTITFLIKD